MNFNHIEDIIIGFENLALDNYNMMGIHMWVKSYIE